MKLIPPITINDSNLTSSNVPETDYTAWNSGTTYAIGDKVIRTTSTTHRIYESLRNSNTNNTPEDNLTGTTPYWLDIAPTNKYAMFDGLVGTATTQANNITVTIAAGKIDSVALLDLTAASVRIVATSVLGGGTVYDKTSSLILGTGSTGWYSYFTSDLVRRNNFLATDIPSFTDLIVTIYILDPFANVSCGVCVLGKYKDLGYTQTKFTASIIDYSRKDVDAFGNFTITKRRFSKRFTGNVFLPPGNSDTVVRTLTDVRSTAIVWIGDDNFDSTFIYGYYREFEVMVEYDHISWCNITIEGLT